MRAHHGPIQRGAWTLILVLAAAACERTPQPRSQGLARQLREIALTAERDSLLQEIAANGKLLSDIQVELATVEPRPTPGTPESPALELTKDQRAFALERIRAITARLRTADTQLAVSERRAKRLTRSFDSLTGEAAAAKTTISELTSVLETQRATIEGLSIQVEALTSRNLALSDSVFHLTDDHNTAFYVVGTRAELIRKGVLVEDGHRAVPFIGRRSVQPARELPLQEFTSIDRSATRNIPLPREDKRYRIVSRQNLTHLTSWVGSKGQVQGSLAIGSPEGFWEASRYLIVVEQ